MMIRRKGFSSYFLGAVPVVAVLVGWELLASFSEVIRLFIPPPSIFLPVLIELTLNGTVPLAVLNTLRKAFFSYSLAAITAIPIGVLLGWKPRIYRIFEPIVEALRPIPSVAMIAPAIIFFGLGDQPVQFITYYALFWLMFINSLYGIYGVDKLAVMAFRTMHARERDIFLKLMLPAAVPHIAAGLRQALAVAMIVTTAGEMIAGSRGLGYFLLDSERSFHYESVYAALLVLSIIGYALNKTFRLIEGRALRWAKETSAVE